MIEQNFDDLDWLRSWRDTEQAAWLLTLLDAFEPFAPLGSQMIWVAQPGLGWLVGRDRMSALARALETPAGIDALRHLLRDDHNA